jgi:hypothetical protein
VFDELAAPDAARDQLEGLDPRTHEAVLDLVFGQLEPVLGDHQGRHKFLRAVWQRVFLLTLSFQAGFDLTTPKLQTLQVERQIQAAMSVFIFLLVIIIKATILSIRFARWFPNLGKFWRAFEW